MKLPQLHRVRWAVRGGLLLGVAASVTANVLHANPNPISQVIAAWPPLALLLTIELIARVPVHRRSLAVGRMSATVTIAGIAAWVSYWHMSGVAARYGETGAAPYLLPFSVDGLVIVASVCLVELNGRIRAAEPSADLTEAPAKVPADDAAERDAEQPERVADEQSNERSPRRTTSTVKVERARRRNPALSQQEIATKTGLSLATVRRQWALTTPPKPEDQAPVNGRVPQLTTT